MPLLVIYGLVFWFFRVPDRNILDHKENVIAPVDGKVVMIKEVEEDEFIKGKAIRFLFLCLHSMFISADTRVRRSDLQKISPGKYLVAWHEKSSTENERTTVAIQTMTNHKVVFRQIAGYVEKNRFLL